MSFTMRADESVTHAVRGRAQSQLEKAAQTLGDMRRPLSDRIHEMRTSVKKVRALIALAASASRRKSRRADRRLRKLAATTSALRDAQVLLDTFDHVWPAQLKTATPAMLLAARSQLSARLRAAERTCENDGGTETLMIALEREQQRTRAWVPRPRRAWNKLWRAPCRGVGRGYRRARRGMKRAYAQQTAAAFHDWRKAVKAHRYQLNFLRDVWPEDVARDISELERLGELLGQEHDLTVLMDTMNADPPLVTDDAERQRATTRLDRARRALRAEARLIGRRLFEERARFFRRRLQVSLRADGISRTHVDIQSSKGPGKVLPRLIAVAGSPGDQELGSL